MRRSLILAGASVVGVTAWTYIHDDGRVAIIEPVVHARPTKATASDALRLPVSHGLIDRESWEEAIADPFVPKQPPPPPPPVYVAPPPVRPTAPPFPFKYVGRTTSPEGVQSVYLSEADRLIPVTAHDTLNGTYRVESINDTQISIIYLPLGETTVLTTPLSGNQP